MNLTKKKYILVCSKYLSWDHHYRARLGVKTHSDCFVRPDHVALHTAVLSSRRRLLTLSSSVACPQKQKMHWEASWLHECTDDAPRGGHICVAWRREFPGLSADNCGVAGSSARNLNMCHFAMTKYIALLKTIRLINYMKYTYISTMIGSEVTFSNSSSSKNR